MTSLLGDARIRLRPDTSGFEREARGSLLGATKGIALAMGGVLAAVGVGSFIAGAVEDLKRVERINAQTQTTIKSMGNVAGVSAQHVSDLAGNLEKLTTSEAEATQEGANLLLTFGNIKNGVGAGNDIFDQTVKTMVDMSRAMGTDTKGSAIQLGKALNDPVKGLTALSKVGVSFDKSQQDLIKTLTASGDVMGAQKVILKALEQQFGGSAEAFAQTTEGKIENAKNSLGNLGETLAGATLPVVASIADAAADLLDGLTADFEGGVKGIGKIKSAFVGLYDLIVKGNFSGALRDAFGWEEDSPAVDRILDIRDAATGLYDLLVRGDFNGSLSRAFGWEEDSQAVDRLFNVRDAAIQTFNNVRTSAGDAATYLKNTLDLGAILGSFYEAAKAKAGEIFSGIEAGVSASDSGAVAEVIGNAVKDGLIAAFSGFGELAGTVFTSLKDVLSKVKWGDLAMEIGKQVPVILLGFVTGLLNFDIGPIFQFIGDNWLEILLAVVGIAFAPAKLLGPIAKILGKIPLVGKFIEWFLKAINGVGGKIAGWIGGLVSRFVTGWRAGGPGIISAVVRVFDDIILRLFVWGDDAVKWFKNLPTRFSAWLGDLAESFGTKTRAAWDVVVGGFARGGKWVLDTLWAGFKLLLTPQIWLFNNVFRPLVRFVLDEIPNAFRSGVSAVGKFWDELKNVAKTPVKFVVDTVINKGLIDPLNALIGFLPGNIGKIGRLTLPAGFARGGILPGSSSWRDGDDQLVPMRKGEGVYVSEAMRDPYERARLQAVNAAARSGQPLDRFRDGAGYAKGGIVELGKWFQSQGARVGEHPAFGSVGTHAKGSQHYTGNAIDVNYGGAGANPAEKAFFDRIVPQLKRDGWFTLWQTKGHYDHLHVDTRNGQSGGVPAGNGGGGLLDFDPLSKVLNLFDGAADLNGKFGEVVGGVGRKVVGDVISMVKDKATSITDYFTGDSSTAAGEGLSGQLNPEQARSAARLMMPKSWSWDALNKLWQKESGWRWNAQNPRSLAFGIPQALPGRKMAAAGADWQTNATTQIKWGIDYIAKRYLNSQGAWAHSQKMNWYAKGTPSAQRGLAVVGERGPELVNFGGGERVFNNSDTRQIMNSNAPLVGTLNITSSGDTRRDLQEANFQLRKIRRGGVYAR